MGFRGIRLVEQAEQKFRCIRAGLKEKQKGKNSDCTVVLFHKKLF